MRESRYGSLLARKYSFISTYSKFQKLLKIDLDSLNGLNVGILNQFLHDNDDLCVKSPYGTILFN